MCLPYTYLIGWITQEKYYYGVRYAKNCHPNDLWTKYFTSSRIVKNYRMKYGEPNIIQIRKVFLNTKSAKKWEDKVLRRMNVLKNNKFLNKTTNYSFRNVDKSWNDGLTKENCLSLKKASENISKKIKEKQLNGTYINPTKGKKKSIKQIIENRWRQISNNKKIPIIFNSYFEFSKYANEKISKGKKIWSLASELHVDGDTIKKANEYYSSLDIK